MAPAVENPHGAEVRADGTVRFRIWAPAAGHIDLELVSDKTRLGMNALEDGWHELVVPAQAGTRYRFVLPDELRVPDPASRHQPEDVHGPSEVVDLRSGSWTDSGWKGRPWHEAVIYELHIGTFTPEGTFRAAIGRLDHLASLGITAIEIMPVADFPGTRNWGYDGVLPYAPDSSYGRPEDFQALVDAAHARGLMVLLDVVYNHFGPVGNYLHAYAPQFFTDGHHTPWGAAINFDAPGCEAVREFFVQNAIYWIQHFHIDGLRFDAVHAIRDDSPKHILHEIAERAHAAAGSRQVHLVLENEENQAALLERNESRRPRLFTAQWNDDVHHVLHTAVTREDKGYYAAYLGETEKLGRALAEGFAFQGDVMVYRGRPRGEPSAHLPPDAFVSFLQNHDQIGNRAFGERIGSLVSGEALRAAAAVYLLLPQVPMLFMGEEWNASNPFPFFCDFGPEMAEQVRKGRREEFARFPEFQDPEQRERIPDPQSPHTFAAAKLPWRELGDATHQECVRWYQRLLDVRRRSIVPLIERLRRGGGYQMFGAEAIVVRWPIERSGELMLAVNLSGAPVSGFPPSLPSMIWREGRPEECGGTLQPWTVVWSMRADSGDPS